MVYLDKIQAKGEELRRAGFEVFVGCTEEEVAELEQWRGCRFPLAYREFLLWMGHWGGGLLMGSDCFYEQLKDIQIWAAELLQEDQYTETLPEDAFVFLMHQGYQFFFFRMQESDDPAVYYYLEEEEKASGSEVIKYADHFSEWLDQAVDKAIKAAHRLAEMRAARAKGDPELLQKLEEEHRRLNRGRY
jgi:hypothetical protein